MEYQYKKANLFGVFSEALATGISKIADVAVDTYDNVKIVLDSPEVKRVKVITSFAKMGLLGDITQINTITRTMFPLKCRGIEIDYGNPYYEKCPKHGTKTFRTSEPDLVWCPLCMNFLIIEP